MLELSKEEKALVVSYIYARCGIDLKTKEYKTLIVTMGTSGKGMGAAGIEIDDELARVENLITEARNQGILVLGFHIEGEARRSGACENSINLVAPLVDYLIVRSDGNLDGRFDEIAKKNPFFNQVWAPLHDADEHNVYGREIFDEFKEK